MNEFLHEIMTVLLRQSWQLIVLVMLVWPISQLSQRRYPRFTYMLWISIAIKSLLPFNIQFPAISSLPTLTQIPIIQLPEIFANSAGASLLNIEILFGSLWLLLVIFIGLRVLIIDSRFRRSLINSEELHIPGIDDLLVHFKIDKPVKIATSQHISVPLTRGINKPIILLPYNQKKRDTNDLLPIIAHELAHIQRKDLWAISLQVLLNVFYFFHPIMRVVNRHMDLNRERICDEMAMEALDLRPQIYGRELLSHLEASLNPSQGIILSGGMFMNKANLIKRFEYLVDRREKIVLKIKVSQKVILGLLIAAMLFLSCSAMGSKTQPVAPSQAEAPRKPASPDVAFVDYDTPPSPVGGLKAIQEAIVYNEAARKEGVEGTVVVQLKIGEQGQVSDVSVVRAEPESKGLEEAAMQAVKSLNWNPARKGEMPVAVQIAIPIVFKLENK